MRLIDADLLMRKCDKWLKPKAPDEDEMDSDCADITDHHTGKEQGNDECKEWSEQWTGCCEDDYYGHYYWETEYPDKYLHMEFWV